MNARRTRRPTESAASDRLPNKGLTPSLACRHSFTESRKVLFVGTEAARLCEQCFAIEVLVYREWVGFDEYLDRRRAVRAHACTTS